MSSAISKLNTEPTVTIVVPAYREPEYIGQTLSGLVETFRAAELPAEIIVVLDVVPYDETSRHVREASKLYNEIRVLERQGKRGVGDAIRAGIRNAKGKIVIPVMGDQSENPDDIVRLASKAADCDIVFTNRFKHGKPVGYPLLKYVANRCCNYAAMVLFRIPYSDITNAFKAYKKDLLNRIQLSSEGFEIFLETPVKAMKFSRRTKEIEVSHSVKKKQSPKLSVVRDGYKYARVLVSLLRDEGGQGH
jgi:glycosyltransferase involved in cell wall biosynthesis